MILSNNFDNSNNLFMFVLVCIFGSIDPRMYDIKQLWVWSDGLAYNT